MTRKKATKKKPRTTRTTARTTAGNRSQVIGNAGCVSGARREAWARLRRTHAGVPVGCGPVARMRVEERPISPLRGETPLAPQSTGFASAGCAARRSTRGNNPALLRGERGTRRCLPADVRLPQAYRAPGPRSFRLVRGATRPSLFVGFAVRRATRRRRPPCGGPSRCGPMRGETRPLACARRARRRRRHSSPYRRSSPAVRRR